jgi:hypothetical protein
MHFSNVEKIYFLESRPRCKKMLGAEALLELEGSFSVSYSVLHKNVPLVNDAKALAVTFVYGSPIVIDLCAF